MKATMLGGFTAGVCLLAAAPAVAHADVVTFNFETLAVQSGLTILTMTSGGLTATLTRPGSNFDIINGNGFGLPASFGSRSLSPFEDQTNPAPFVINFSQAITGLSIDMGDFGEDNDVLMIQLFSGADGTGTLLGTSSLALDKSTANPFSFLTPSLTSTSARSAKFVGGSTEFPNSVYYDNLTVTFTPVTTTTPEPGTLALFASGLAGVVFIRRKKRD